MKTSITHRRKFVCSVGLAVTAFAVFAATASAGDRSNLPSPPDSSPADRWALAASRPAPPASRMSREELRALRIRSQELNRLYGPAESVMPPEALRALRLRGEAMNRFARSALSQEPRPATGGIDWPSVGIGAAGGSGFAILSAAIALLALRRRHARLA